MDVRLSRSVAIHSSFESDNSMPQRLRLVSVIR